MVTANRDRVPSAGRDAGRYIEEGRAKLTVG
jgi:hypothetical protein